MTILIVDVRFDHSIARFTGPRKYFMEATKNDSAVDGGESYQGATVLEPNKGCYFSVVACLDFASLYPSIMRAHNLSHETWVRDVQALKDEDTQRMSNGETFVQTPTGILTLLLEKWASDRKSNKKKMMEFEKLAHDTGNPHYKFMEKVYDARQKANKVCMNSLYGFCGVGAKGMQPCSQIASTVTCIGRDMITHTKACCERLLPGSRVIYGDSVMGDTPLLVRRGQEISFVRIDQLFLGCNGVYHDDKEYGNVDGDLCVWSDKGFTPIKRIIRHHTTKRIYRVRTNNGLVDVTEDHSLLRENAEMVCPKDVKVGTALLHHPTPEPDSCTRVAVDEATMTAYFFNTFYKQLLTFQDRDGNQCVPSKILSASVEAITAFFEKCRTPQDDVVMYCDGKLAAAGLVYIGNRLGYVATVSMNDTDMCRVHFTTDAPANSVTKIGHMGTYTGYVYDLETDNHHFHVGPGSLVVHNTDSVFWDLWPARTVQQDPDIVKEAFVYCESAAVQLSKEFAHPNKLEFEKVFCPLLMFGKKRYSGQLYSADLGPEKPKKIDNKGLQLVRRDSIPFLKKLMNDVLTTIHSNYSHYQAMSVARTHLTELFNHRVPLNELSASKKSNPRYKVTVDGQKYVIHVGKGQYTNVDDGSKGAVTMPAGKPWTLHLQNDKEFNFAQAHIHVMRKIDERCPGSAPAIGERVWYVYGQAKEPGLQYEQAEDLQFALDTPGFKADVVYYYEHSVKNALESIFEIFTSTPGSFFEDLLRGARNKRNRQKDMESFFVPVKKK